MSKSPDAAFRVSIFRRKLIVLPHVQIALLLHSAISCLAGIAVTHVFYRYSSPEVGAEPIMPLMWIYGACVTFGVIGFSAMTYGGIILTNRHVGPLYRLKDHMLKIAEGTSPEPFRYRKGDFFPELGEAYNRLLKRVR